MYINRLSIYKYTVENVNDDSCPRRFRDIASVIAGVSLTGVGDVQTTDGPVRQQVRFHTNRPSVRPRHCKSIKYNIRNLFMSINNKIARVSQNPNKKSNKILVCFFVVK